MWEILVGVVAFVGGVVLAVFIKRNLEKKKHEKTKNLNDGLSFDEILTNEELLEDEDEIDEEE